MCLKNNGTIVFVLQTCGGEALSVSAVNCLRKLQKFFSVFNFKVALGLKGQRKI